MGRKLILRKKVEAIVTPMDYFNYIADVRTKGLPFSKDIAKDLTVSTGDELLSRGKLLRDRNNGEPVLTSDLYSFFMERGYSCDKPTGALIASAKHSLISWYSVKDPDLLIHYPQHEGHLDSGPMWESDNAVYHQSALILLKNTVSTFKGRDFVGATNVPSYISKYRKTLGGMPSLATPRIIDISAPGASVLLARTLLLDAANAAMSTASVTLQYSLIGQSRLLDDNIMGLGEKDYKGFMAGVIKSKLIPMFNGMIRVGTSNSFSPVGRSNMTTSIGDPVVTNNYQQFATGDVGYIINISMRFSKVGIAPVVAPLTGVTVPNSGPGVHLTVNEDSLVWRTDAPDGGGESISSTVSEALRSTFGSIFGIDPSGNRAMNEVVAAGRRASNFNIQQQAHYQMMSAAGQADMLRNQAAVSDPGGMQANTTNTQAGIQGIAADSVITDELATGDAALTEDSPPTLTVNSNSDRLVGVDYSGAELRTLASMPPDYQHPTTVIRPLPIGTMSPDQAVQQYVESLTGILTQAHQSTSITAVTEETMRRLVQIEAENMMRQHQNIAPIAMAQAINELYELIESFE